MVFGGEKKSLKFLKKHFLMNHRMGVKYPINFFPVLFFKKPPVSRKKNQKNLQNEFVLKNWLLF